MTVKLPSLYVILPGNLFELYRLVKLYQTSLLNNFLIFFVIGFIYKFLLDFFLVIYIYFWFKT